MSIPTYDKFYRSILKFLSDGKLHNSKEMVSYAARDFKLSKEDMALILPSGRQTILANRVGWAKTYLKKAGLIDNPSRGQYRIMPLGRKLLDDKAVTIDNACLMNYKGFRDFVKPMENQHGDESVSQNSEIKMETPLEIMDSAYNGLKEQLADSLLTNIMAQSPEFFERLVIELLQKMGYGQEIVNAGEVTGKTGDEGIDGIIRQDVLGFDKIYVQAKRWADDHTVGEPEIQQFAGALLGKGASKGLFITTSHFSKQAVNYVEKHMTARIVLIDGTALTKLMIQYGLGVSVVHTYEIMRVDSDYFNEDDE